MTYALNNKINQHLQCIHNIYIYIYIYQCNLFTWNILVNNNLIRKTKDTMRNGITIPVFVVFFFVF